MTEEIDVFSDDYIDNQVDLINNLLNERNYARLSKMSSINGEITRPRRVDRKAVRDALTDPIKRVDTLQEASSMLRHSNGIYSNLLNYNSNILTNDYILIPKSIEKLQTKKKADKEFSVASAYAKKFNIKSICPIMYDKCIEQGEYYFYELDHGDKFVIQEMPNWLCKIVGKTDEVLRYGINLQKLSDKTVLSMPREIQLAYSKFKNNQKYRDKLIDKCYYTIENGFAFCLDSSSPKGIPYYANVLDDLMELEDMKDLKSESDIIESVRLIHQKIPFDKDTKRPLISVKEASAYHYSTKENLPKGTSITTNPLDLQALTLANTGGKINNKVSDATNIAFDTAGINQELFNGKKNSNEAIALGSIIDTLLPRKLQKMVQDWLNYKLRNNKATSNWELKFIGTTVINQDDKIRTARENATVGMPTFELMAASGYEPYECTNLRQLENILGISEIMIPQQTSHTMSGKDNGRPSGSTEGTSTTAEAE